MIRLPACLILPIIMPERPEVPIYEQYEQYPPPFSVKPAIQRMLSTGAAKAKFKKYLDISR